MQILKLFSIFFLAVFFNSCSNDSKNNKSVKQLDSKLLETKNGKSENQKVIPVYIKKENFKNILVPIVTEVYTQLDLQYNQIKEDIEQDRNHKYIESLKKYYKAKTNEELLMALKPHPISITLAQSAIESAWLTSRFTKVANNIFGVWSFRKNEPRVEANGTRGNKKVYLKKYKNYKSAILDYYKNIAKGWAYKEFRKQKMLTDDPYVLVEYLQSYSEKGAAYTDLLKRMIATNQFDQYDIKR